MGENTPISLEYTLNLHIIDFIKELNEVLTNSTHVQLTRRNMTYVSCFEQHVYEANRNMPIPFSEEALCLVMIPLTTYLQPFCNSVRSNRSVCLTISNILNQLINNHETSIDIFQ